MTVTDAPETELAARIESRVDRSAGPDACHPWTGHCNEHGYGMIHYGTKHSAPLKVHRIAWELAHPDEATPPVVRHRCDNPPCCNARHLLAGTQADNNRDRDQRDRVRHGDTHPAARLTAADVVKIRRAHAHGETLSSLARAHGVTRKTIANAVNGRTWRRVAQESPA